MQIGTVDIPSQLVLAPMAGVTDLAFRLILPGAGGGPYRNGNGQRQGPVLSG